MHYTVVTRSLVYSLDFIRADFCSQVICYIFPLGPILNHVQRCCGLLFFRSTQKKTKKTTDFLQDLPMIVHVQHGFNQLSNFWKDIYNMFPSDPTSNMLNNVQQQRSSWLESCKNLKRDSTGTIQLKFGLFSQALSDYLIFFWG